MSDTTAKPDNDWMSTKWRPAMGWTYMSICILDMAIFPILWSLLQAAQGGQVTSQWNPLTLQGAGLFHIAMGAVLGVAAWSRGQEKLAGVANGYQQPGYRQDSYYNRPEPYYNDPYYQDSGYQQQPSQIIMINGRPAPQQPQHREL